LKLIAILIIVILSLLSYTTINKKILNAKYDIGDAPQTYGYALHANPEKGPFFGKKRGDKETVSTVKNSNFNDCANNVSDEDVFHFLTNTIDSSSNKCPYKLEKKQKSFTIEIEVNNVKEGDPVKAWIDLNGNGIFEKFERTEMYCSATSKIVALTWNISELKAKKSTFLRLRICDKEYENFIEHPDTKTKTGEVEDYEIIIQ
jgi:hypothetical protein